MPVRYVVNASNQTYIVWLSSFGTRTPQDMREVGREIERSGRASGDGEERMRMISSWW
jgi:hypothetical protein